jgi:hypothetical protein
MCANNKVRVSQKLFSTQLVRSRRHYVQISHAKFNGMSKVWTQSCLRSEVKYGFYCTDFHETCCRWIRFYGHLLFWILSESAGKWGKYWEQFIYTAKGRAFRRTVFFTLDKLLHMAVACTELYPDGCRDVKSGVEFRSLKCDCHITDFRETHICVDSFL